MSDTGNNIKTIETYGINMLCICCSLDDSRLIGVGDININIYNINNKSSKQEGAFYRE